MRGLQADFARRLTAPSRRLVVGGIALFAAFYQPRTEAATVAAASAWPGREAVLAVMTAGLIRGLFNVSFAATSIIFAILMLALPRTAAVIWTTIVLGLLCGLPAGPIMSLPARVLKPETRAAGMGIFYTVYYAAMMLGPVAGGACAKWTGSAAAAFDFGAAALLVCPTLLWAFNRVPASAARTA